jgi:hypothetical protein
MTTLSFVTDKNGNCTESLLTGHSRQSRLLGSVASLRLQVAPAIFAAQKIGISQNVLSLHSNHPEDMFEISNSTICLIAKMSSNNLANIQSMIVANLAAISYARNRGAKIILLYSDNWVHSNKITGNDYLDICRGLTREFYRDLLQLSDYVVYPTQALLRMTANDVSKQAQCIVIEDPWQLNNWHEPRPLPVEPGGLIKLIWFGSNLNINYLISNLPSILSVKPKYQRLELTILSAQIAIDQCRSFFYQNKNLFAGWSIRLVLWDAANQPNQLEDELTRAHICLIPSDPDDQAKAGVSPNRLVDAIKGGCISIASPMESYREFRDLSLQGSNFRDLLLKALRDYKKVTLNLKQSRELALKKHSPNHNEEAWRNLLLKIIEAGSS